MSVVALVWLLPSCLLSVVSLLNAEGRKKRTAKRLSLTNVTELLLACFAGIHLTLMLFALLQKDLFKGMWSLAEGFFKRNYCHSCHTRCAVVFPLPSCCISSLFLSAIMEQSWETITASRRRGRWERREGNRRNASTRARASLALYLKINRKRKMKTSYADHFRRSPKNIRVGGYKRDYFRRSKPGCHGFVKSVRQWFPASRGFFSLLFGAFAGRGK